MDPLEDFETSNARQWDQDSMVSVPASSRLATAVPPTYGQDSSANGKPLTQDALLQVSPQRQAQPEGYQLNSFHQQRNADQNSSLGSSGSGSADNIPSRDARVPQNRRTTDRSDGAYRGRQHPGKGPRDYTNGARQSKNSGPRPPLSKARWARPEGLVTTRRANDQKERQNREAETMQYLNKRDEEEDFPGTGFYLWPTSEGKPTDLLGWKLEKLDKIRIAHKVFIEWHEKTQCLKIDSRSVAHSDRYIEAAIQAIRRAISAAKAQAISALPMYIISIPTASAMRSVVRARILEHEPKKASEFELAGAGFSEQQKAAWKANRPSRVQANLIKFEKHFSMSMKALEDRTDWMRMRVHFGHVFLTQFPKSFGESGQPFETFISDKMMAHSRIAAGGKFNKKFDNAKIVMDLKKKIVDWPERFLPVSSRARSLEEVTFKDTVNIFVAPRNGEPLRIEAEVDRRFEEGKEEGEYQIGTTRLFKDNQRNSLAKVTTVDIERNLDWELEVISDCEVHKLPTALQSIVEGSVSAKSPIRKDELGMLYPGVCPLGSHDVEISSVVVRSDIQYMLQNSQYVVEIAIYREWLGSKTEGEPKVFAGVTMFHQDWDLQMESFEENMTDPRHWKSDLSSFFHIGNDGSGGLQGFLDEVGTIQGFLSDAATQLTTSKTGTEI